MPAVTLPGAETANAELTALARMYGDDFATLPGAEVPPVLSLAEFAFDASVLEFESLRKGATILRRHGRKDDAHRIAWASEEWRLKSIRLESLRNALLRRAAGKGCQSVKSLRRRPPASWVPDSDLPRD
jgi:hypothetical protein